MNGILTQHHGKIRDISMSGFLLFCAVFFGIPLLIIVAMTDGWLAEQERLAGKDRVENLERIFGELDLRTRPFEVLLEWIRKELRPIPLQRDPILAWNAARASMKAQFGTSVGFIWTTPAGDYDAAHSDITAPPGLIKNFFRDQRLAMQEQKESLYRNISTYRRFFGPLLGRGRDTLWGRLILTSFRGAFEQVYFSDWLPGKSQFIVFFRPNPDWPHLIVRCMVESLRKNHPEARFHLRRLSPETPADKRSGLGKHDLDRILALAGARGDSFIKWRSRFWGQLEVSPGLHMVVSVTNRPAPWIEIIRTRSRALAFAVWGIFAVVGWFMLMLRGVPWLSIRYKLGILFLYVVAFPLTLVVFSTQGLLRERAALIQAGIHQDHERVLRDFDRRFNQYLGRIEVWLQKLLEKPISPGNQGKIEAGRRLSRTLAVCQPEMAVLIDEKGDFAYREMSEKFVPLFRFISIARHGIKGLAAELNHSTGNTAEGSDAQFAGATAEYFGLDIDLVFAELSRNLGFLNEFVANNSRLLTFLAPVYDTTGRMRYVAIVAWRADLMQWRYVHRFFGKAVSRLGGTEGFALCENSSECWPSNRAFKAEIQPYSAPLSNQILPLTARLKRQHQDWILTGLNGLQLNRYQMFALSPVERFSADLTDIRWRYGLLCAVFLLVGIAVGGYLARYVLEPIGYVADGVQAIAERRFEMRIPVLADDEFGHLSMAFNDLLADTEDLEVARVIQESFFPAGPVELMGWQAFGTCIPASHVGGDFFHYRPISPHQLLIIVGDVSGHGVSAALVVAMARALVTHPDTSAEPDLLLKTMQKVFVGTLNRRKMMTCFAALWDTRTGILKISNAGHNYPLLVRGKGNQPVELLEASGMPLGARHRFPFESIEIRLEPEDWILFYTDGLIEALDRQGGVIGYDRLSSAIRGLKEKTAAQTSKAVQEWFFSRIVPGPLEDDVTVVVLQNVS